MSIARRARFAFGYAVAAGWLTLAGCTSQPPVTTTREARPGAEQPDPERRARVRLELAGLYLGRGQTSTALEEVNGAIAAKPDFAQAYDMRGLIYGAMSEFALAEENFKHALQLAPRNGNMMHNYGWVLCQQRRYDEAEAQFKNALAQPQYADAVRTLLAQGVCDARAGRWAAAEAALSRSYQLDPSNPVTGYNFAAVLLHASQLDRARFVIGRVNAVPELASAQSLWLAARIERRLGNSSAVQELGRQLRERFPQAPETQQFEQGLYDE